MDTRRSNLLCAASKCDMHARLTPLAAQSAKDPETLANLVTCCAHCGKPKDVAERYKSYAPTLPLLSHRTHPLAHRPRFAARAAALPPDTRITTQHHTQTVADRLSDPPVLRPNGGVRRRLRQSVRRVQINRPAPCSPWCFPSRVVWCDQERVCVCAMEACR